MGSVTAIDERIHKSRADFMEHVWPVVSKSFPAGKLVPVEAEGTEISKLLDIAGIDHFFCPDRGEPYGVSQRVLTGSWGTLTLRATELRHLRSVWGCPGALAPAVLIQGYVNPASGGLRRLDAAIALRTEELLAYVRQHPGQERNGAQGSTFYTWNYDDLDAAHICSLRVPARSLVDPLGLLGRSGSQLRPERPTG